MYIAYFDESGDDGYPKYSSEIFVLSSLYLHHQNWKQIFEKMHRFRRDMKNAFGIPVKIELHTKAFLLDKKPFHEYNIQRKDKILFCKEYAMFLATMDIEFINVVIKKKKINSENESRYKNILDAALSFNIQRIENTIKRIEPATKFLIITDEGRVGKMRNTTRRIQKVNFIPSRLYPGTSYRGEIEMMIEDPLPKNSKESYCIQACDFVSFFTYLYLTDKSIWHNRLYWLSESDVQEIVQALKPCLNIRASKDNDFGIVVYPK